MRAYATERQHPDIHPPPYERPRDAQDASCVSGRDLRIIGEHRDAIGGGQPFEKIGKGGESGGGQCKCVFGPIAAHKANIGMCRIAQSRSSARTALPLRERYGMPDW